MSKESSSRFVQDSSSIRQEGKNSVGKVEESQRDHKGFHSLVVGDMMALGMQQSSLGMVLHDLGTPNPVVTSLGR